ncbi:hypothetical protein GCWU000246_01714 [Jonquetella anthropi E3_33 E1]|nr:hypothetical protein GCWU000246_01714 [Jonquetella anthropi E3_33 E1]
MAWWPPRASNPREGRFESSLVCSIRTRLRHYDTNKRAVPQRERLALIFLNEATLP